MSLQMLQEQVLHLSVSDRLTLMNTILQSLTHELNFQTTSENNLAKNRYPLRGLPIQIAEDFDEPLPKFGIHSQNNSPYSIFHLSEVQGMAMELCSIAIPCTSLR